MPRILLFTASMGEGHNTAARATAAALERRGTEVLVADPYSRTNPVVNRLMQKGYAMAINRYPKAWKVLFDMLGKPGVVEGMQPILIELRQAIRSHIREFRPDLLVSTYPVFAFLISKLRRSEPSLPPLYTIVTDSTRINPAWYRWPCAGFIVADQATAAVLREGGVPAENIHPLGFPLPAAFDGLEPAPAPAADEPWKIIFFPGGSAARAAAALRRMAGLNLEVTVVTGRRTGVHAALAREKLPARGALLGWTDEMPRLMATHHVFVGKAGGATVQEAIAAKIPFIVSHVVPGQEEG
ncbi:MAG: hypothetical protein N2322_07865, partial [Terrimicrobiaceae bacterium]|nr:hypothetical protein [Terrimicrobiaceae bacterium]